VRPRSRAGTLLDQRTAESILVHRFCLVTLLVAACAVDVDDEIPGDEALDVCTGGPFRCLAKARVSATDSYTMFASAGSTASITAFSS